MSFGLSKMALPDTIRLTYYSLPENQFYRLRAPLPQERIKELLEARYPSLRGEKDLYYSSFTVGMAPCGYVSLWMVGGAGWLLVDTFRAEKTEVDFKTAFPFYNCTQQEAFESFTNDLYPFIREEMRAGTLSSRYWEDLTKTYSWKLRITDPDFEVYNYSVYTINVERRIIESAGDWLTTRGEKAVPAELILYLKHEKDPIRYKLHLTFEKAVMDYDSTKDEEELVLKHRYRMRELMNLFESFYAQAGDEEVELVLDFNDEMTDVTVMLRTATWELEIPGCEIAIYDSERYKLS